MIQDHYNCKKALIVVVLFLPRVIITQLHAAVLFHCMLSEFIEKRLGAVVYSRVCKPKVNLYINTITFRVRVCAAQM